jgi:hypothetical protein
MAALAPGLTASAPRQSSARMSSAGRPLASIPRTRFCPSNAIASPAPCADDPAGWFQYLCQSRSDALLTFQGRRKVRGHLITARPSRPQSPRQEGRHRQGPSDSGS